MPTAAFAFLTMLAFAPGTPETTSNVTMPRPSAEALTLPQSSDSPELLAATDWAFE